MKDVGRQIPALYTVLIETKYLRMFSFRCTVCTHINHHLSDHGDYKSKLPKLYFWPYCKQLTSGNPRLKFHVRYIILYTTCIYVIQCIMLWSFGEISQSITELNFWQYSPPPGQCRDVPPEDWMDAQRSDGSNAFRLYCIKLLYLVVVFRRET